jgi:hypothetical protein
MAKKKREVKSRRNPDDDYFDIGGDGETSESDQLGSEANELEVNVTDEATPRRVLNLDDRKLTKSQKSKLVDWRGANAGKQRSSYFTGQLGLARTKFGHESIMAGSDTSNLVVGIPCPALSFEYLITQDVFPLGVIMQLVGKWGSNKSSLVYEFFRWFDIAGGGSILMENETKFSPELCYSIMGYGKSSTWDSAPLILNRCESVEDWQDKLTWWIAQEKHDLIGTKDQPGPGRTIPILFSIDSLMGKSSQEVMEKVKKEGHTDRRFPVEALKITDYFRTVPQMLDTWPFALVMTNHLKMGKDEMGRDVRNKAGGTGVSFQESFELETSVVKTTIECAQFTGKAIRIKCFKNSFGTSHRQIITRMLWWEEEDENGRLYQKTVWDWDWSTIHLLSNIKGRCLSRLKDSGFHIDTPRTSDIENLAWSRTLGMTKADARPWHEVGAMIRQDKNLMSTLRKCLGIKNRPLLQGDYLDQLDEMTEDLE